MLKIENSLCDEKVPTNGFGNGLGLDNLRKRLDILYPNNFELKILEDEDSHLTILKLNFAEHTEGVFSLEEKTKTRLHKERKAASQLSGSLSMAKNILLFFKF